MQDYSSYTDEELIEMYRGSREHTGISDYLIEKYKNLVRKKARAMYLIGAETDDLIQEGMIGLFKAVQDYQPDKEASFQTFARICIDRQVYSAIQSSRRQKHQPLNSYVSLSENGEETEFVDVQAEDPETIIIDRENTENLQVQIKENLSVMENKVLECYLEGNDYNRIAQLLGKTPKSIDNALRRIRTKIRRQIDDFQTNQM